jgi:hypothetical protein
MVAVVAFADMSDAEKVEALTSEVDRLNEVFGGLAPRLGEVARQLHAAYGNPTTAKAQIAEALEILDLIQADI